MSHTNHTQYYELPQYIGSDIINPLVDTNGAYETIDTTMHNIAAEAAQDTADVAALQSKVGSGIFQTTAQNATDAVNELVGELDTADTGIKARLTTAENDIDTLQSQMVTAQGNITDLQNNKASASDVSALQTTVGNANSGLVKDVADNASDIGTINTRLTSKVAHSGTLHQLNIEGDGVKTIAELLAELRQALITTANNLTNETDVLEINELVVHGRGSYQPVIGKNVYQTSSAQYYELRAISANAYDPIEVMVLMTSPSYNKLKYLQVASDNATSYHDWSNSVLTSGQYITARYYILEQI